MCVRFTGKEILLLTLVVTLLSVQEIEFDGERELEREREEPR